MAPKASKVEIFSIHAVENTQYALKGQKPLAQGIALGTTAIKKAPCKGKSFANCRNYKAFALTGRQVCAHNNPGRCPGLRASAPSGRATFMTF